MYVFLFGRKLGLNHKYRDKGGNQDKDTTFRIPLQSDTMNDLIHFVGHCNLYFYGPTYMSIYFVTIRCAPLSSFNSCYDDHLLSVVSTY